MNNKKILVTGGGALLERARDVLGWTPRYDNLDTIVQTSLAP